MSITTAQIRGARGILNWSQQDLAKRTGISATSIGSIENGITTPRENTLTVIRKTFESTGIEFIGMDGVRLRTGDVKVFKGRDGFIEFYDHLYETLVAHGGEVMVSNVDERLFVKILGDFTRTHIDRITALGTVSYKILVKEGDTYAIGSNFAEYRWIPHDIFATVPFYVFDDYVGIMMFEGEPSIILLKYPSIADTYRVQFEDMWQRSKEMTGNDIVLDYEGGKSQAQG